MSGTSVLALDVGGANLKGAHSSGRVGSRAFALWKKPDRLAAELAGFVATFPAFDRLALTMTAELCDCYATKRDGVLAVLDAVASTGAPVRVWGLDGALHDPDEVRDRPGLAAAANWLALATVAAAIAGEGEGVLVDVGSTTTDVIPLLNGRPVPAGRTDTERLRSGELVYVGVRRTPVCALGPTLPFRGRETGLAAELFATTHDVFLTLGLVPEDAADVDTADGRPATRPCARDRLARMVGADREGFSDEDALAFATAAVDAMVGGIIRRSAGSPAVAVVSGSGEFLARRLAATLVGREGRIVNLSERWGPAASAAACAYALARLAASEA